MNDLSFKVQYESSSKLILHWADQLCNASPGKLQRFYSLGTIPLISISKFKQFIPCPQPLVSYLGHDKVVEAQQAQHAQPQPAPHRPVSMDLCLRSATRQTSNEKLNMSENFSQIAPRNEPQKLIGECLAVQSLQVQACCPLSAVAVLPKAKLDSSPRAERVGNALASFT